MAFTMILPKINHSIPEILKINHNTATSEFFLQVLEHGTYIRRGSGTPLARAEVAAILNVFFDRTTEILISEERHGKKSDRQYKFEPSFIIRGLDNLYLELKS